jgi:hypothetical protein
LASFETTVHIAVRPLVRWLAASCAAFVLSSVRDARAYRPFDGTDGDVADFGEFELEVGPVDYVHAGDAQSLSIPTVLNLGIIPRMELVADFTPYKPLAPKPTDGYHVVDTDVFVKILLLKGALQEEDGPSIALETGPLLPEYRGESGFGASANLIVSERWKSLTLHLNNTAELTRSDLELEWSTGLIGELDLGAAVRPVAELTWSRDAEGLNTYSALGGAIWEAAEGLDLDAALLVATTDGQGAFEARVGLTWAVSLWGSERTADATAPEHQEIDK